MTDALELVPAARALGVAPSTLQRWAREGAPIARPGRRGRGGAALFDPCAVRAWRASQRSALAIASVDLPRVVADAIAAAYVQLDGPHKRACAGFAAAAWYATATAILDHLRAIEADVGDVDRIPENIARLRAIYVDSVR